MKAIQGVYRENGYVKIRIWLAHKYNPDGTENKPYRRSMGAWNNENIQLAKLHIEQIRRDFERGVKPGEQPEALPAPVACDIYYKRDWLNNPKRSAKSIRNTKYGVDRIKDYWRSRSWHTLLPKDLEAYIVWRRGQGIANGTINRELAIISAMFTKIDHWVQRREIGPYLLPTNTHGIPYNPAEYVERSSTIDAKRERVPTEEELRKVKAFCDKLDPDMLEIITRNILSGLRKTDLEKVNGHSDVRGILSKSREKKLFKFPLDFSRKLNYTNFRRRWDAVRKACGMKDFHWHDWRHTSGTMLSREGFTDEQIREFYGHSTVEQTRDYINRGKERLEPHVASLRGHLSKVWGFPVQGDQYSQDSGKSVVDRSVSNSVSNQVFEAD